MMNSFMGNWKRSVGLIIILSFMMVNTGQFSGNPWLIAGRVSLMLICASVFALPRTWWNRERIILLTCLVSLLIVVLSSVQKNTISIYLLIAFTIPAAYIFEYPAYYYYLTGVLLEMFLLLMIFGHRDYPQTIPQIILFLGLALSLRARINRQEAYRISQEHLAELEKAHKELQLAAVATMQHAVLDERARIAREIHDAVGHSLTSLIVQLQALRYMIDADPVKAQESVAEMLTVAREGLQEIRISVHDLAADRSALGITPLQALVAKVNATTNLKCTFSADSQADDLPIATAAVLFKVLQEAITNIHRHSQATLAEINLTISQGVCSMIIRDNGKFTGNASLIEGFGLKSMRERVEEAAGKLEFTTAEPSGLLIKVLLPLADNNRANEGE